MVYVVFERMFMVFYGKLLQAMILQCVSWKQTYITSLYNVMSLLERKEGGGVLVNIKSIWVSYSKSHLKKKSCEIS